MNFETLPPVDLNDWHLHSDRLPLQTFALFPPVGNTVVYPITHVAIRYSLRLTRGCSVPMLASLSRPARHHNLRNKLERSHSTLLTKENSEMGFLHPVTGEFLNRFDAMQYALDIGQIRQGFHWAEDNYTHLHSEDLWPDEY